MRMRSRVVCLSAAVAAVLFGAGGSNKLQARNLTWDADGASGSLGADGGGNWDTVNPNWVDGDLLTGSNVTWVNSPADSATFGNATSAFVGAATPNNIDMAEAITAQDITIGTATNGAIYNLSDFGGGSLTLQGNLTKLSGGGQIQLLLLTNGLNITAGNHVIAMKDSPGDVAEMSINGTITGAGGITVDNTSATTEAWGTVAFNVDNSYTGVTNINMGRLVITTSGGLGATSAGTVIDDRGALSIGGAGTTVTGGGVNLSEPITIKRSVYSGGEFGRYAYAVGFANGSGTHTITGPLVVDSTDARIRVETSTLNINTNVTEGPDVTPGTGVLTLDGDFAGFVNLNGNNSGIAGGGIKIIGGVEVNVANDNNLGGASAPITFAGSGTLHPVGGWMTNFGSHVINQTTFSGGLDVDNGQTFTVDIPLGDANNAVGTIGKRGTGTLNLNSVINLRGGQTFWDGGTVNVNNSVTLASLHLRSPIVNIGNGGSVTLTAGYNSFGQDSTGTNGGPDIATINLTGNGQLIQTNGDDFNISDNANTQGTINVHDTAVLTTGGITFLGKGTNAVGTINQDGGTVNINRSGNFALVLGDGRGSTNPTGNYNLSGTGVLNVAGEMYVGEGANGIGHFTMTGGTVNLNNWFVVGRENALGTVDISGNSVFHKTGGGNVPIGESGKANTFALRNNAQFLVNGEIWFANGGGHTATATIQDNAVLTNDNWFVVGRGGAQGSLDISGSAQVSKSGGGNAFIGESNNTVTSTMTVRGNATFTDTGGEFWVGQGGGSGILNIQDNASFTTNDWLAIGRASGASIGVINLSGGTLTKQGGNFLAVGSGGQATINQTGGTLSSSGTRLGEASNGTVNISGGTSTFTGEFHLGHNGGVFGTLNLSNTANVTVPDVVFGNNAGTGGGTINLDGGTLTGNSFTAGAGTGAKVFNFNGGTLKAAGNTTLMSGITANVKNGGAIIDTNGHNVTIASGLVANGSGGLTKNGAGTATLTGNNTYTGATSVTGGALALGSNLTTSSSVSVSGNSTVQIQTSGTFNRVIKTGSVSIATGSKVNIENNKMILTSQGVGSWNGSAYTAVTGLVASGYSPNQDFSGSGIVTAQSNATGGNTLTNIGVASNADLGLSTFGGVSVGANDTLVMYTYGGDANLDGAITGDDYFQIDSGFPAGAHGWFNGDFNYDGSITGDDYFVIDSNFSAQGSPIPTSGGVGGGLAGVQAVPEPASIGVVLTGASALLMRRRRRRNG